MLCNFLLKFLSFSYELLIVFFKSDPYFFFVVVRHLLFISFLLVLELFLWSFTLSSLFFFCFFWHKTFEPIQSNCSKTVIKRKTLRFEIAFPLTSASSVDTLPLQCASREISKCHPRENVYRVWIEKVAFVLIRLVSADSNCISKNITRSLTVIHKGTDRILIFI